MRKTVDPSVSLLMRLVDFETDVIGISQFKPIESEEMNFIVFINKHTIMKE
jgi:hypothetical protein